MVEPDRKSVKVPMVQRLFLKLKTPRSGGAGRLFDMGEIINDAHVRGLHDDRLFYKNRSEALQMKVEELQWTTASLEAHRNQAVRDATSTYDIAKDSEALRQKADEYDLLNVKFRQEERRRNSLRKVLEKTEIERADAVKKKVASLQLVGSQAVVVKQLSERLASTTKRSEAMKL
jgi:hypothetical protein